MELRHLRSFLAVADAGSITGAAAQLYIAQPAVSRQIHLLERQVGQKLFVRSAAGVQLTDAGTALLPHARALLARADDLRQMLTERDRSTPEHVQTLRIGLFLGALAASDLSGPILSTFRATHPHVRVSLVPFDLDDPWAELHPELDVLIYRDGGPPGDTTYPLFEEPKAVIVGLPDELSDADAVTTSDLQSRRWLDTSSWGRSAAFTAPYQLVGSADLDRAPIRIKQYSDLMPALRGRQLLSTTAGSALRITGSAEYGVVGRPVLDVPPSVVNVAVRRPGATADAFVSTARRLAADLLPLVPEARPYGGPRRLVPSEPRRP